MRTGSDAHTEVAGDTHEPTPAGVATAPQAPMAHAPVLFNGVHTLSHRTRDEWYTFKIRTQRPDARFKPGVRLVYLLCGPMNTTDFRGVGEVDERGVRLWAKWASSPKAQMVKTLERVVREGDQDPQWEVLSQGACCRCNRALTTPESIRTGIGPECAQRIAVQKDTSTSDKLAAALRIKAELAKLEQLELFPA